MVAPAGSTGISACVIDISPLEAADEELFPRGRRDRSSSPQRTIRSAPVWSLPSPTRRAKNPVPGGAYHIQNRFGQVVYLVIYAGSITLTAERYCGGSSVPHPQVEITEKPRWNGMIGSAGSFSAQQRTRAEKKCIILFEKIGEK